jgi:hypothetical protein
MLTGGDIVLGAVFEPAGDPTRRNLRLYRQGRVTGRTEEMSHRPAVLLQPFRQIGVRHQFPTKAGAIEKVPTFTHGLFYINIVKK